MTISLYTFIREDIITIQEWFKSSMGFTPTIANVVNFVIHTVLHVPEYFEDKTMKRCLMPPSVVDRFSVVISDENTRRLGRLMSSEGGRFNNDKALFVAVMITYRAATLSVIKQREVEGRRRATPLKAERNKYLPQMMDKLCSDSNFLCKQ